MSEAQIVWKTQAEYGDYPAVAVRDGWAWGVARNGACEAVDAETGETRWKLALTKEGHYAPTVDDEAVFFATSKNQIVAASRSDAAERWRASVGQPVFQAPTRAGDLVVVRGIRGETSAFDARSGERRWSSQIAGSGLDLCRPLVIGDRILLAHDEGIAVVDFDGKLARSVPSRRLNALLDDGSRLCSFAQNGRDFNLHDRETFEITRVVKGDVDTLADVFGFNTTFVAGVLYTKAASTSEAVALDLTASDPQLVKLGTRTEGPVTCIDDTLYVTPRKSLVAYDRATRAKKWELAVPTSGFVGPVVRVDDVLVVPSESCVVAVRV